MKLNQEILDELGKIVVNDIVDRNYKTIEKIIFKGTPNPNKAKYYEAFSSLNESEKTLVKDFFIKNSHNLIFDFLKIFSENSQFKLIYEEGSEQVNLNEISESLMAELIIEDGWIARFSQVVKKDEII